MTTADADLCMTGDGNQAESPTALCRECLDRPYHAERPATNPDRCNECFEPVEVWHGNAWGPRHMYPGWRACRHECHDDEVVLA